MKKPGRKCFGGFLATALGYISLTGLGAYINEGKNPSEANENAEWVASSRSWLDRQLCGWFGLCGTYHLNERGWTWDGLEDEIPPTSPDFDDWWSSGPENPDSWSREERSLREIPQYVFDYAPYVHLFSGEAYWPCDLGEHLVHTSPHLNYTKIVDLDYDRNLTNLHELNDYERAVHGRFMFLQSDDNVEELPDWLGGAKNIPTSPNSNGNINQENHATWSNPDNLHTFALKSAKQQAYAEHVHSQGATMAGEPDVTPPALVPSTNGRCGGNSGFTCKDSNFGKCCSIYGWCGDKEAYCGEACEGLAGRCNDPYEPLPRPHADLRRRRRDRIREHSRHTPAGKSSAPVILIVVPKEEGIVDAFWFFFYSFNEGQTVFNIRFGNHVADWEHTLIRFKHGIPETASLSEHNFGGAYAWEALEKYIPNLDGSGTMIGTWSNATAGKLARRPVLYSADGSHAMYATPGLHPYVLPYGILHDQTDRGPLWDPSLNARSYTWDYSSKTLRSSTLNPKAPTEWFHYAGRWGDKVYPLSDPRQYRLAGQYHYVNGPTGPRFKNLDRKEVCQSRKRCQIRHWVGDTRIGKVPPEENNHFGGNPGGNSTDDG